MTMLCKNGLKIVVKACGAVMVCAPKNFGKIPLHFQVLLSENRYNAHS
jgi:hypothetical protein